MHFLKVLPTLDYHTEGEPMRIVTGGLPPLPGRTMMEKSNWFEANMRDTLQLILYEPRGHAGMCGAILVEPTVPEANVGVVFIEPSGCVHMCGHGAIAIATALVETGVTPMREPVTELVLETAAGLVGAKVHVAGNQVTGVTIQNVPAFSYLLDGKVFLPHHGPVDYDIAYGGHFYAIIPAKALGLELRPENGAKLVSAGEAVRERIEAEVPLIHPAMPKAKGLLYIQFSDVAVHPKAHMRNAVVVAPKGIDRSPCGTGTSARMANLHARGRLKLGEEFVHESIIGTLFYGKLVGNTNVGETEAVIPEIRGRAYCYGMNRLVLRPDDPFPAGFML